MAGSRWERVLVTGAAGFLGSHLSEQLLRAGCTVIGIDNFDPFYPRPIKEANITALRESERFLFFEGDLRDQGFLEKVFLSAKPQIVVHLAAKAGVRPSLRQPEAYYQTNVIGTLRLLEVMRQQNVPYLVFASSSSVYGNRNTVPFRETDPVDHPVSPYAATKKAGELLCYTYHHLYDFSVSCLRFFTVYGPRQRPEMAIHKFTRLIDLGMPVTLYGDGSSRRDYTYVDDVVAGILLAMEHLNGYEIFNLGESQTISLLEVVRTIERHLGKRAKIEWQPFQPGDVYQTYADISKAQRQLGYRPTTDFDTGIQRFCQWYQQAKAQWLPWLETVQMESAK